LREALSVRRPRFLNSATRSNGTLRAEATRVLPAYSTVVDALIPVMQQFGGAIVTIDGRGGVGKTTLGRYLAWRFNVTLIETDLFLIPAQDYLIHLDDQINRIIERRITTPLPVLVEGISMLQLMTRINRVPDFSIYVANPRRTSSASMQQRLLAYETAFTPSARADIVVTIEY
jgi:uridine kinase